MLDAQGNAKISDFGLARCRHATYLNTRIDAGTVAYLGPEAFDPQIGGIGNAIDLFSLAVVMWQLVAHAQPWEGLSNVAIIYQVAVLRTRNPLPADDPEACPPRLAALIERCWATDPRSRPDADHVVSELEAMLEEAQAAADAKGAASVSTRSCACGPRRAAAASLHLATPAHGWSSRG